MRQPQTLLLAGALGLLLIARRSVAPVIAAVLLTACGSGGGSHPAQPPTISALSFSPSTVTYQSGGGTATLNGSISFTDPAGGLSSLVISSSGGTQTISISGVSGQTSGMIAGAFQVSTATLGQFSFQVWVADSDGNTSNKLAGSFDVVQALGATWTQRSSPTTSDLRRIAWSGSRYVAVGVSGTIVSSPDGISWTLASSGTSDSLYGVTWSGSRFVAVGDQGTVLVSPDGMSWGALNIGRTDVTLLAVADSGGELVVVGGQGNGSGAQPGSLSSLIMSSSDDVTWAERPTAISNWAFYGVAWSGSSFVAIGQSFTAFSGDEIWSSTDGVSWSSQTINTATGMHQLCDLTWSGANFLAIGHEYGLLSADGINWQAFGALSGANTSFGLSASAIAYAGGNYLAVADGFGEIATSTDAINWSQSIPAAGLGTLYGAVGGNSQFIVVGQGGTISTSP